MRKAYVVKKGGKNVIPPSLSPSRRNMLVVNVGRLKNICLLFITPSFPIIFCKDGPIVIKIKKIQQKRVLGVFDLGTAICFYVQKPLWPTILFQFLQNVLSQRQSYPLEHFLRGILWVLGHAIFKISNLFAIPTPNLF